LDSHKHFKRFFLLVSMVGIPWKSKKELINELGVTLVSIYEETSSPVTTRTLMKKAGETSWHTAQRYLEKLEGLKLIKRIEAPNNQIMWFPIDCKKIKVLKPGIYSIEKGKVKCLDKKE
jgi:hypothetical protein